MKLRSGFVSNSSTSSFIIFGKIMGCEELERVFKFTPEDMNEIKIDGLYDFENTKLKGLDFISLFGGDKEYVIGKKLKGNGVALIEQIFDTEKCLGTGCILYHGIDSDGECYLDD